MRRFKHLKPFRFINFAPLKARKLSNILTDFVLFASSRLVAAAELGFLILGGAKFINRKGFRRFVGVSLFAGVFGMASLAMADQVLLDRNYSGHSDENSMVVAKRQIQDQAIHEVSENLIKEIIGEAKFSRNKALIQDKILSKSSRYFPYIKPGDVVADPKGGFSMSVNLKVSLDDLQTLLLENALLYESDLTPSILPMVAWVDQIHHVEFHWWEPEPKVDGTADLELLKKMDVETEQSLRKSLKRIQFYSVLPHAWKWVSFWPDKLKNKKVEFSELQPTLQKLGAQILLRGEVFIDRQKNRNQQVQLNFEAVQVQNNRIIGDVSRNFENNFGSPLIQKISEETDAAMADLVGQISEAWTRGSIGSSVYRLTIQGELPLSIQEQFKDLVRSKFREVKSLKDRMITADTLTLEVESSVPLKELAAKMTDLQLKDYRWSVVKSTDSEITLETKAPATAGVTR